ncbi:MAG: endonuclease V [Isosphaera sp.]|nr:endonuclease V [Isosphaera sp.]
MNVPHLHDWPTTAADAVELQTALAARVDVTRPLGAVDLVAGCDAAYHPTDPVVCAAVVVVRVADGAVVETATATREANFPYMPGLLSFRELPAVLDAFAHLRRTPDAVMLDGQGVAHPRRFGSACHLGLWLGLPAVGCAKSWLVGEYEEPGPAAGDAAPLTVGGEVVGAVVRSAAGAKPVFVSPGHLVDADGATRLVRAALSGYRHPTPTRAAHLAANALRDRLRAPS